MLQAVVLHAIENCHLEAIKLLVQFQANLNLIYQDGNTVLHYAARCPHEDILVSLLIH